MSDEQKKKILIIEDEKMLADMYALKFSKEGFQVIQANNGVPGLELAKREKPIIILLDIILPKKDGFAVLKELKEDPAVRDIPVILLTNLGQDEDIKKGINLGASGYLIKANFTPGEIVTKVKEILNQQKKGE